MPPYLPRTFETRLHPGTADLLGSRRDGPANVTLRFPCGR